MPGSKSEVLKRPRLTPQAARLRQLRRQYPRMVDEYNRFTLLPLTNHEDPVTVNEYLKFHVKRCVRPRFPRGSESWIPVESLAFQSGDMITVLFDDDMYEVQVHDFAPLRKTGAAEVASGTLLVEMSSDLEQAISKWNDIEKYMTFD